MRTTIDLPSEVFRAAKARSAEAGETLKSLLTRALVAELQGTTPQRGASGRVRLPLFGSPDAAPVHLSNADLERALIDADGPTAARQPGGACPAVRTAPTSGKTLKLVDVNVWIAAAWARHAHHSIAKRWLDAEDDDLLFCRMTELAWLRLVTSPAVTRDDALTRRQAWDLLLALQADPRIKFVAEPRGVAPLWIAFSKREDRSHLTWTDDYLAAFAQALGAELVTLDRAMRARYPSVDVRLLE